MTQIKYASIAMPVSNLTGIVKGGKYWISDDLTVASPSTWTGIILDSDGRIVGSTNKGISVWNTGSKKIQINKDGIQVIGGSSFWGPDNYLTNDGSTWRGTVIDNTGINLFQVKNGMFDVDENLDLMPSVNNALLGTPRTMVKMTADGLIMYGGAGVWVPEDFDASNPATYNGVVIDWSGIYAFHGSNDPTVKIDGKTGDFALGASTGPQLKYTASTGIFSVPAISTDILAAGSLSTGTGVILDSTGITAYKSGNKTFALGVAGALVIGPTISAGSGVMIDPDGTVNGDITKGISCWKFGVCKTLINENGGTFYGGSLVALPDNYNPNVQSTWTGVVINSTGISSYNAGALRAVLNNAGMALYGGSNVWVPDNYDPNVQSTWNGVLIKQSGLQAFKAGVLTFEISNTGNVVSYGGNLGMFPIGFDPNVQSTWNGVVINSAGIQAYKAGVLNLQIDNAGSFIFGSTANKRFMFNGSTGVLTIEPGVVIGTTGTPTMETVSTGAGKANTALNTNADYIRSISSAIINVAGTNPTNGVVLDNAGLRGYGGGVCKFNIDVSGNAVFSGDIAAATVTSGSSLNFQGAGNIQASSDTFFINSATQGQGQFAVGYGGTEFNNIILSCPGMFNAIVWNPNISGSWQEIRIDYNNVVIRGNWLSIQNSSGTEEASLLAGVFKIVNLSGTGNRAVYSDSSGNLTNSSSDRALKTAVETIPYGLAELLKLKPIRFQWAQSAIFGDQKEIGFIAQEVETVVPEVVGMNYDGMKSLDYPKLTAVLCKSIQEQNALIATMQSQIKALQAKVGI